MSKASSKIVGSMCKSKKMFSSFRHSFFTLSNLRVGTYMIFWASFELSIIKYRVNQGVEFPNEKNQEIISKLFSYQPTKWEVNVGVQSMLVSSTKVI